MIDWSAFANFSEDEFRCKCGCGLADMNSDFLSSLQQIRNSVGPMIISSGYRCPNHNMKVSSTGPNGPHTTGRAADIFCHGEHTLDILEAAKMMYGFGLKQHGPHKDRYIHLDDLEDYDTRGPRPWIWTYP